LKQTPEQRLVRRRIAIFTDSFPPRVDGISSSVQSLIDGFLAVGSQLVVFTPSFGKRRHLVRDNSVTYYRVPSIASPLDGYPFSLPSSRYTNSILRAFAPDFVSVQTLGPIGLAGLCCASRLQIPIALSWHTDFEAYARSYPLSRLYVVLASSQLKRQLRPNRSSEFFPRLSVSDDDILTDTLRLVASRATILIVPSVKAVRNIRRLGIESPTLVLPTGVQSDEICGVPLPNSLARLIDALPRGRRIIYVGRLSREKDLEFLLCAFESFFVREPQARLILVGPCKDMSTRRLLARVAWRDRLLVSGPVPRRAIHELLNRADIFMTSSISETQGISIWEACLAGLPVAARDELFCEDLSGSGQVLCGAKTPTALAQLGFDSLSSGATDMSRGSLRGIGPTSVERAVVLTDALGAARGYSLKDFRSSVSTSSTRLPS
jgi:glycosyltransferase involved in cell wall biosynthesis